MTLNRYAATRDRNEPAIVEALELAGASVTRLSMRGVPDLLVGYRGATFLLEVKLPAGPRGGTSHSELNEDQELWWAKWRGHAPVLVRSAEDALRAIGVKVIEPARGPGRSET